jgi:hypothetical protein
MSAAAWAKIARGLCEHGERRVSAAFVSADCAICIRGEAVADGKVDDEARDLIEIAGRALAAHREKDALGMEAALQQLEPVLTRLHAEQALIR